MKKILSFLLFALFSVFLAMGQAPIFTDASKWPVFDGNKSWLATALEMKTYIGAGVGTVTAFSSGNLSPLFTTNVATSTTTPALTFSLSNAGANTYFGNATGGSTAPSFTAAGALTKTDDTNVTLTLGGNPATSLLRSASLTLGWTGVLAASRGGTNNGFTQFSGPASSAKTFTLPNTNATILTDNAAVTVAQGGTGVSTITGIVQGNGTGAMTGITNSSTTGQTLRVTGASTYAWGALDLANSSAITGSLPFPNGGEDISSGRATAQTALNSNILTVPVGGSDQTYMVSINVLITTSGSESFSCSVTYTDEGNTSRVMPVNFSAIDGSLIRAVRGIGFGAAPYAGVPLLIRCKASTNIVFKSDPGTYTGCTYNIDAVCKRMN